MAPSIVVVGASLAGAKAVEGARAAGFDGRLVLVGEEGGLPYDRPKLSKEVLRGEADLDATLVHPADWYVEHDVELVDERAVALDADAGRVRLAGGDDLPYDALVLATGTAARTLPGPDGVHVLRTAEDAERLRAAIGAGARVAVVGAGWIGSEVAASARQMGAAVVLVDPNPTPLHRLLGADLGEAFRALHAEHGVELRLGVGVDEIRGHERVEAVALADGRVEPADVVVAGVGVVPRTEVVEGVAGIEVDNGIVVDEHLETGRPGVFAVGDVANAFHPGQGRHLRIEHWANALNQGLVAGGNAAGRHDVYDRIPFFFSDQYDLGLEYVGRHDAGDSLTVRGDLATRRFIAYWQREGRLTAAMNVNWWDVVETHKALIAAGDALDPARLADEDVPLEDLLASG